MDPDQAWLTKGQEDLETADFNQLHKKYAYAAFLYQQAVEKSLKALLLKKGLPLKKVHDCATLARLVDAPEEIIKVSEILTSYYFKTRYPDESNTGVSAKEVLILKKFAKEVIQWIKNVF